MNNQAKMIIITSNEDLIQQFSLTNSDNTRIIDLDENNSTLKENHDNNYLDLDVLAQLSEINSNNDQMYKRVLNSPSHHRSKTLKSSKKGLDLFCVICEDRAIGFNYDVLTCASCKAFFRRNAQYQPEKLRCLTGQKNCPVNHEIHRKCQRCRLARCLEMGMRKDFILTEEEKQRRRQRIEENRKIANDYQYSLENIYQPIYNNKNKNFISQSNDEIDQLLMDIENLNESNNIEMNISSSGLSIEDWSEIEHVRLSYSSIFENQKQINRSYETPDKKTVMVTWSEFSSERALKIIHFCQQIDEFENLNKDDQFILIKYNLLSLFFIQKSLLFNPITGKFNTRTNDDNAIKRREFFCLFYGASGIRENYLNLLRSFSYVTEQDSTLIYLIMIILLFTKGLSMSENETILNDVLSVNHAQSHYIKLIWNYLLYKYGEKQTIKKFIDIITQIERIQLHTKYFRDYFRTETQSEDITDRIAPLMQAILNIA